MEYLAVHKRFESDQELEDYLNERASHRWVLQQMVKDGALDWLLIFARKPRGKEV